MATSQELGPEYARAPQEPVGRTPRGAEIEVPPAPLGLVALHNLWKKTKGTLSIDLKRKLFKGGAPGDTLWRPPPAFYGQAPPGPPPGAYSGGGYGGGYGGPRGGGAPLYDLPSVGFMNTGARVKVLRHLQFGPKVEVERPSGLKGQVPTLDFGFGLAFELDTAELQPQVRLKFRDILSIKALPYPALKIQKRLALPEGSWGVRLSYECPLEGITTFYQPPARLLMSIDNMQHNGVQLTQAGLEFNYAGDFYEGNTQLRAAGLVALPRELPIVEGQPMVGLELKRLGLKAAW
ncbi:hypothetical protein CHLNCDRAFT_137735 [Chlorella variabilis]|uniref:Uncharacterized protein n=1 Tax=Chlorella variabilis TaxID=554065 RepID=E1Z4D3_CHLVA|nr:hypothetical protein CHLNCDRAFT_137735 [Chlorella variabilis]EFN59328.1 hypothetical protein CHLNCDRAFT_137735 [Chlorella variabilis]|eukprot:XP_005851430.1 hypothetical protein CHLNCDRAFT_137735 [Chlorella variabilis]